MLRKKFKWRSHENESTDARHRGGATRSSDEVSVMGMTEQVGLNPIPDPDYPPYRFFVPARGQWWSVESTGEIFKVQNPSNISRMIQASGRIEMKGCYCSIYEECWIFLRSSFELEKVSSCEPRPEILLTAPSLRHTK